jgi:hypothetical protein
MNFEKLLLFITYQIIKEKFRSFCLDALIVEKIIRLVVLNNYFKDLGSELSNILKLHLTRTN